MKKRLVSIVLLIVLVVSLCPVFASADSPEVAAAEQLYELGLFRGTGTDADGKPVFDLERAPSRIEALVMLVRLLGKEEEALNGEWKHPFTDVPAWADGYVAYAYENGLTNGISATLFDPASVTYPDIYFTFVLRALGYSDRGENAQFVYNEANKFALNIGLTERDYAGGEFLRGDVATASLAALSFPLYGETTTLIGSLIEAGAVPADAAGTMPIEVIQPKAGDVFTLPCEDETIYAKDILAIFPTAVDVLCSKGPAQDSLTTHGSNMLKFYGYTQFTYQLNMYAYLFCREMVSGEKIFEWDFLQNGKSKILTMEDSYNFIIDSNLHILGYIQAAADGKSATATAWSYDLGALIKDMQKETDQRLADCQHLVTIDFSVNYKPDTDEEGNVIGGRYPIYLDGKPLPAGSFVELSDFFVPPEEVFSEPNSLEKYIYLHVLNELYFGSIINYGSYGLHRQSQSPMGALYVMPDGNTAFGKYLTAYSMYYVYDQDLNLLGYGFSSLDDENPWHYELFSK